jgi:hypothetical protein
MTLGCVRVQVWSTETVNRHVEGQVEMGRTNGVGRSGEGRR